MTSLLDGHSAKRVEGSPRPRYYSAPAATSTGLALDGIDLAAAAGLHLDEWQRWAFTQAMGETSSRWAASEVGIIVPRQNGKGALLEARELTGLFLTPERLIVHSAHEMKTALEAFRRILELIQSTPDLDRMVKRVSRSNGEEGIELKDGSRLRFFARSKGSGRGFTADCVIFDEAYELDDRAIDALLPTQSATPNPQTWFTSSAPRPSSEYLFRLRKRGRSGESTRLAWMEWAAAEDAEPGDPAAWADANPALGIRLGADSIARELESMSPGGFARERLSLADDPGAGGSLFAMPWDDLAADAPPRSSPTFAVATAPDRSWSSVSAAWQGGVGVHVQLVAYAEGTAWVPARIAALKGEWGGRVVVDTASRGLVPDADEPSPGAQAQAHNALADAVEACTVSHAGEPAVSVSVRGARWKPSGDTRALDRKGSVDISPLISHALAFHTASTARPTAGRFMTF